MPHDDSLANKTELLDRVLERMADGEILTAICKDIGYSVGAFSMLAVRNKAFGERYARARREQAAAVAEDVVRIIDEEDDPERIQIAIGRSNARKWLASRLDPAKWGDKMQHEHRHELDPVSLPYADLQAIATAREQPLTIEHEPTALQQITDVEDPLDG